ncbi:corrinoid protein [Clostridium sp. WLY-B-L2]|uniref:Corrinoid protein n=1 Tax=Clostridium aromativorans TaxID=2836848 RepID=A0ABS8N0L1_9CLOT|nr:corrinoid protein [Clostridium aromativorans]MCC9293332.1 corrinoid protein [Clostridium aromativorans]
MNLEELSLYVQEGNLKKTKEFVLQLIKEKISAKKILDEALIAAMEQVGIKFKNNEIYVPEMLIAAKAMSAGLKILEPILTESGIKPIGTVVIGTVKGDLHDIGKNLVKMMMQGAGIKVHDLGVDVSPEVFVEKAAEVNADIVGISALLTTTMPSIGEVIKNFKANGVRDRYVFMIGGAPVTDSYAKQVDADIYMPDAATAAEAAKDILIKKYLS